MKLYVSTGNSRMDKKFNGAVMEYDDFAKRLSQTTYTAETMEQYRKLPKGKQDDIKDVGGFVLGKLKGGRRKKTAWFQGQRLLWIWTTEQRESWMRLKCSKTWKC